MPPSKSWWRHLQVCNDIGYYFLILASEVERELHSTFQAKGACPGPGPGLSKRHSLEMNQSGN